MDVKKRMDPVYAGLEAPDFDGYEAFRGRADIDFMGWADPYFPDDSMPKVVREGILQALDGDAAHYTLPVGSLEMRKAVAERVRALNGIDIDPNENVVITNGSDPSYMYALRPFLVPGERTEVLVPAPTYSHAFVSTQLMGAVPIPVPTCREKGYDLDAAEFEKRITPYTKAVILVNPNNPTTTVYSEQTLRGLSEVIIRNNLILIIDQCFEETVFDETEMFQVCTIPGMFERTILMSSFSKSMGLCGLRLAYMVADKPIMEVLQACAVNYVGAPNTIIQKAILAALRHPEFIEQNRVEFQKRALAGYELLKDIPGVYCHKPESGFYLWLEVDGLGTSAEVTGYLLEEAHVAVSDGTMFGTLGEKGIRVIVGAKKDMAACMDALERIKKALEKYPKHGR